MLRGRILKLGLGNSKMHESLTLPPLKVGGFFLHRQTPTTPEEATGLPPSPEAITASPAANTF